MRCCQTIIFRYNPFGTNRTVSSCTPGITNRLPFMSFGTYPMNWLIRPRPHLLRRQRIFLAIIFSEKMRNIGNVQLGLNLVNYISDVAEFFGKNEFETGSLYVLINLTLFFPMFTREIKKTFHHLLHLNHAIAVADKIKDDNLFFARLLAQSAAELLEKDPLTVCTAQKNNHFRIRHIYAFVKLIH